MSPEDWIRERAQRQVISTMVQGSTADLVKFSMLACYQYLQSCGRADQMVLMIHDDLQFDLQIEGSARQIRELKYIMEQTCQDRLSVPIVADVEYFTDHWSNKKELAGF